MKNLYSENYYERGLETGESCYSNYRWIAELTIPMAMRLIEYLKISENETVLDFGCAKGYLVYALRLLHRKAFGFDISHYAIKHAKQEVLPYVSNKLSGHYNWILSKDVFEHISYEEIDNLLMDLHKMCKNMFCVVPLGDGKKYNIPSYELDVTHIIREDIQWWKDKFKKAGFNVIEARYKVKHIKSNWAKWENGNGFFILEAKNDL